MSSRWETGIYALTRSILKSLHGVMAAPLSAAYTRRVEGMSADAPEKQGALELPTRVGSAKVADEAQ